MYKKLSGTSTSFLKYYNISGTESGLLRYLIPITGTPSLMYRVIYIWVLIRGSYIFCLNEMYFGRDLRLSWYPYQNYPNLRAPIL
jgi:hypothetical protein